MQRTPIGIRKTASTPPSWCVVLAEPTSVVPGRQRPALAMGAEFRGAGAKARAIRAAGTNNVIGGAVSDVPQYTERAA